MEQKKLHYGYIVVAGIILLGLVQGMVINTVSLFYTPVSTELGVSLANFGWFPTITTLSTAFLMSFAGDFFKKFDTRISLTACVLIYAVCNFARAIAKSIWVFYITGALQGFSSAVFIFMLVPVLVQNWFSVKQGTLIGICAATQGLGASLFSAIGGVIIENMSWRGCYYVWTAVTLIIGLPVALLVIRKFPSDKNLLPVGYETVQKQSNANAEIKPTGLSARQARHSAAFFMLALFCGVYALCNVFNGYLNSYITAIGYTASVAGTVSSMVMLGMTIGKIVNGMICDKSLKTDIIICTCTSIIAFPLFVLIKDTSVLLLIVGALLYGWTYSSLNVIAPIVTKQLFGQKDFIGVWANIGTVQNFIGAFGYTAWGWVIAGMGYSNTMLVVAVMYAVVLVVGLAILKMTKPLQARWTE